MVSPIDMSGVPGLDGGAEVGVRDEPDGYVMLRLGGSRYAVGMSAVAEVGRLPKLTRVPGTPGWLAGVANWRGRILAVLDLRPLLDAPITPTGSLGRLVVLTENTVTVGLLTEGVQGVVGCDSDQIEPPPMTLDSETGALLIGQFTEASGPTAILDPTAVLNLRLRLPAPRRAG
ncbi:MAG: chemotaxis protein CheW [Acidothermaceae bacterium]